MFVEGYRNGVTPNPCVRCNGSLRIDAMVELADRLGAAIAWRPATTRGSPTTATGRCCSAAADEAKDQTYMLSALEPATLARLRFPLADLTKPEVREPGPMRPGSTSPPSARARTSASSPARASARFLQRHGGLDDRAGEIVDQRREGARRAPGHHHFTVGQRRGLGVGGARSAVRARHRRRRRTGSWSGPR